MSGAVTLANGETVTSEMTARDVHNAVAKSLGVAPVERPTQGLFNYNGPPIAYKDQSATLPQPPREEGIAQPASSGNRLSGPQARQLIEQRFANLPKLQREQFKSAYDAALGEIAAGGSVEMYADGSMRTYLPGEQPRNAEGKAAPPAAASSTPDGVDQRALDALERVFRGMSPQDQEANRALFEKDLAAILQGRRLDESMSEFQARKASGLPAPSQAETADNALTGQAALDSLEAEWNTLTVEEQAAERDDYLAARKLVEEGGSFRPVESADGWQSHVEDGEWVPVDRITLDDTSGYTIPQYVDDQRMHASTFELLRQAKAAGITQEQVDAVLHQQAVGMGWVNA